MSHKKDALIILAILVIAAGLFFVSRQMPSASVEGRTADVTLAPDAVEVLDELMMAPDREDQISKGNPGNAEKESVDTAREPESDDAQTNQEPLTEGDIQPEVPDLVGNSQSEVLEQPSDKPSDEIEENIRETPAPEQQEKSETDGKASVQNAGPLYGPVPGQTEEVRGYVVITVGGRQYGDPIPMDRDKIITIRQDEGTINKIHITPESVYMEWSTCENQDCVGEGEITLDNYKTRILSTYIICLPHNLQVEMIPVSGEE